MASDIDQKRVVGEYAIVKQIGSGSFSVVWKGTHRVSGADVAIKEIQTEKLSAKLQESLESEISILQRAKHPNIVKLTDLVKTPGRIYLILEFCAGGDLSNFIRKNGPVNETMAQNFLRQLGSGLQVLRSNNLIHRDLKPQNLLLTCEDAPSSLLKIADFGFARSLQPQGLAETLCGSPLYMAPEILQCQKYDAKADLWSVGAILFELLTGRPPFGGQNHVHLLQNIKKSEARIPKDIEASLSSSCTSLIHSLLKRNPVERLTFDEFFHHPFLALQSPERVSAFPDAFTSTSNMSTQSPSDQQSAINNLTYSPFLSPPHTSSLSISPSASPSSPCLSPLPPTLSSPHASPESQTPDNLPFLLDDVRAKPGTKLDAGPLLPAREVRHNMEVRSPSVDPLPSAEVSKLAAKEREQTKDSFESIENEYVLIDPLRFSSETFSPRPAPPAPLAVPKPEPAPPSMAGQLQPSRLSPCPPQPRHAEDSSLPSSLSARPQDQSAMLTEKEDAGGRDETEMTAALPPEQGSLVPEDLSTPTNSSSPSPTPQSRILFLHQSAKAIEELAAGKMEGGMVLDAFSVHLVGLAVWREALGTCHEWAAGSATTSSNEQRREGRRRHCQGGNEAKSWDDGGRGEERDGRVEGEGGLKSLEAEDSCGAAAAARFCDVVETEFLRAVEKGEDIAACINPDDPSDIPDAIEVIFQAALIIGRSAAVEELMGNMKFAEESYSRSATLLLFLLLEAPNLPICPSLELSSQDSQRLQKYADAILARKKHCSET